jgi:hypothetical protein
MRRPLTEEDAAASTILIGVPMHQHTLVMAEQAGATTGRELAGGSHALSVSEPEAVTATIVEAVASA